MAKDYRNIREPKQKDYNGKREERNYNVDHKIKREKRECVDLGENMVISCRTRTGLI